MIDPHRPEYRGYSPTSYRDWRVIRKRALNDPQGCFIDYGAGLGRSTILAAQLPFSRVIGLDVDHSLVVRARDNIDSARCRRAIEIIECDATAFDVPLDASVLYFYNPFAGSVLRRTIERALLSYERKPRQMLFICNLPHKSASKKTL